MEYQITIKEIPGTIVYSSETILPTHADILSYMMTIGAECMAENPDLKCTEPHYEYCEYLDDSQLEKNVRVRHNDAVTAAGRPTEHITFRSVPPVKALCVVHKGEYESIAPAYAYLIQYARSNGYTPAGLPREAYIDGVWNCPSSAQWRTEIQLPVK